MVQQVIGIFIALRICSLVPKPRSSKAKKIGHSNGYCPTSVHWWAPTPWSARPSRSSPSPSTTDSERSHAGCLRSTWAHFGTTWMSYILANSYQSNDYVKHSKPGYPKKHRTWLPAFYATIRASTTYTISLLAGCSSFFCSNVNLFLTFPWAKVRNR